MAKLVRAHFWHPDMAGSNSIKQVLPAVLNASAELQSTRNIRNISQVATVRRICLGRSHQMDVEDPLAAQN